MATVLRVTGPDALPLLPLLLLQLASSSLLLVHGAACAANTYNDGYINVPNNAGGFTIPNSNINFNAKSFSVELWVRRSPGSAGNRFFFGAGKTSQMESVPARTAGEGGGGGGTDRRTRTGDEGQRGGRRDSAIIGSEDACVSGRVGSYRVVRAVYGLMMALSACSASARPSAVIMAPLCSFRFS